jgi:hypothetical protein
VLGACILLVIYTAGFPVLCFVLLSRAFSDQGNTGMMGWLRRIMPCLRGSQIHKQYGVHPYIVPIPSPMSSTAEATSPMSATGVSLQWAVAKKMGALASVSAGDEMQKSAVHTADSNEVSPEKLQEYRENTFGFLWLSFRPAASMTGPMLTLLLNCYFALLGVFLDDASLVKVFLFGLAWTVQTGAVALYLPFDSWWNNVKSVLVGVASVAHATLLISVQRGGYLSGYMSALITLFCIVCIIALFRERLATVVPAFKIVHRSDLALLTRLAVENAKATVVEEAIVAATMQSSGAVEMAPVVSPLVTPAASSTTKVDELLQRTVLISLQVEQNETG